MLRRVIEDGREKWIEDPSVPVAPLAERLSSLGISLDPGLSPAASKNHKPLAPDVLALLARVAAGAIAA
jgi:hypothetical protein